MKQVIISVQSFYTGQSRSIVELRKLIKVLEKKYPSTIISFREVKDNE